MCILLHPPITWNTWSVTNLPHDASQDAGEPLNKRATVGTTERDEHTHTLIPLYRKGVYNNL